jgi:adenylate kinase family enzyme
MLQWRPGWRPIPKEEFVDVHERLLKEPRWIIDGWGDFDAIENRLQCADTIILIDYPLYRHYWWAIKRQFACIFRPRIDGPPGCPMLPMTWPLLKMIWAIDRDAMPRLRTQVNAHLPRKKVFHVRTLDELHALYRAAEETTQKAAS